MGYRVVFYIIDREYKDKYIFTGYFEKEGDIYDFIKDNVRAGNSVYVCYHSRMKVADFPSFCF
jgi:hypothetical protein